MEQTPKIKSESAPHILTPMSCGHFAKRNCSFCRGRGFLEMSHPFLGKQWAEYCGCAIKRATKQAQESLVRPTVHDDVRNLVVEERDVGAVVITPKGKYYPGTKGFVKD